MDHLIHMLTKEFLPNVEHRHKRQTLGMEGPNLAEKRRRQILTRAPETPVEKIKRIDDLRFEVQSSRSLECYQIDLSKITCNCKDFPNISLCKHIAAVVHFFGGADLGPQPPHDGSDGSTGASESDEHNSPGQPVGHGTAVDNAAPSVLSATNEMMNLLQQLAAKAPRDPKIVKSLDVMRSGLRALVLSATADDDDSSRLPEKENIAPNQHTWPETAARMGEKRGKKHGRGKVDSALTAQHIGEPNRKRPGDSDPYGAGEQSGKRAKPDARSAAANSRARIKAEPPPTQFPPPTLSPALPLPAPPPPPASLPLPAPPPHASFPTPVMYNSYPPPAPLSQPMYSHSHYQPHVYYQSQGAPSAPYYRAYPT
jgi:hypothetical protein